MRRDVLTDGYIELINALFVAFFLFMFCGFLSIPDAREEAQAEKDQAAKWENHEVDTRELRQMSQFDKNTLPALEIIRRAEDLPISFQTLEYDYIGIFYITAYSDMETFCRETASGEEVHYSESNFEPTTCAIDRSLFSFYEIIAVGDGEDRKVYITEDTGSAVIGRHVDVYRETLVEVQNFPTSYQPVYYVRYVDHKITTKERRLIHELNNNYLHDRSFSSGFYCGPNRRAGD